MNSDSPVIRRLGRFFNLNKKELEKAKLYSCGPGTLSIFTRSSPNTENPNEDSVAVIPVDDQGVVLMVADGLGGHANGKDASMLVLDEIRKAVNKVKRKGGVVREAILKGIENANKSLLVKLPGSASTIAAVEVQENQVNTYHVGDSEILVTEKGGGIKYQSIVHSPVGYAVEAGILDENQAIMHDERHLVSNVVGDEEMHIAMSSNLDITPEDTILIASDGLFDNLHKEEITLMISNGSLEECSNKLLEETYSRMHEQGSDTPSKFDDLSFILFRLDN